MHQYTPIFTKVLLYTDLSGKARAGIRELSSFEQLTHSFGLKFPQIIQERVNTNEPYPAFHKDLKALHDSKYVKRPIVLIPECTSTNGRGILQIPQPVMEDLIIPALLEQDFKVHSLRLDHNFSYTNPYNTTDELGLRNAASILSQFFNQTSV